MLSGCFGDSSFSSPYKRINEQVPPKPPIQKQGIVSILPTHPDLNHSTIRRTLSADHMSSQQWFSSPSSSIKRAQSSEQLQALGHHHDTNLDSSIDDKKGAFEDIWSSIQADKNTWGCILSPQKNGGSGSGQVPYIHPLVRRSTSSLSEKSLEICTESLGSETGSDGFSLYPGSEPEDSEKDGGEDQPEPVEVQEEEVGQDLLMSHDNNNVNVSVVVEEIKEYVEVQGKYNNNSKYPPNYKKAASFPPPLPTLAHRDGSNLQMRSHRQDGRLVLEAVSVPSQNCFRAQRHNGRLLLTIANDIHLLEEEIENHLVEDEEEEEEEDDVVEDEQDEDEYEEEEEDYLMDHQASMVNVHDSSSALMIMRKLMELTSTRNKSTWPRNFNTTVVKSLEEDDDQEEDTINSKTSMAGLISAAAAGSTSTATAALNAYEYYWRRENCNSPTVATAAMAVLNPLAKQQYQQTKLGGGGVPQVGKESNNNGMLLGHNEKSVAQQQEMVLVKAAEAGEKAEYLVPFLRGCKEPRRSLLFWEPYCIATS